MVFPGQHGGAACGCVFGVQEVDVDVDVGTDTDVETIVGVTGRVGVQEDAGLCPLVSTCTASPGGFGGRSHAVH